MDEIRKYILSIVCASLLSGILSDIAEKTFFAKQTRIACSIFLALSCLMPVAQEKMPEINWGMLLNTDEANTAVMKGEQLRIQSFAGIIKEEAEAYIFREARSIGADISIDIELGTGDPPAPVSSVVKGCIDASCESELSRIISQLGIPKEQQIWIRQEPHESNIS